MKVLRLICLTNFIDIPTEKSKNVIKSEINDATLRLKT